MTFYRNFTSKDDLVLVFLREHERRWTNEWLKKETLRRYADPRAQLLGIFDLFNEWFRQRCFDGCPFIRTLFEAGQGTTIQRAAGQHISNVRACSSTNWLGKPARRCRHTRGQLAHTDERHDRRRIGGQS